MFLRDWNEIGLQVLGFEILLDVYLSLFSNLINTIQDIRIFLYIVIWAVKIHTLFHLSIWLFLQHGTISREEYTHAIVVPQQSIHHKY